jgi:hypothetical protein
LGVSFALCFPSGGSKVVCKPIIGQLTNSMKAKKEKTKRRKEEFFAPFFFFLRFASFPVFIERLFSKQDD